MWELYDILLEGMNETETAEDFLIGPRWAAVLSSSGSTGIAPVIVEKYDRFDFSYQPSAGMPLMEMASGIRSWNYMESALALAAVNAFYNNPERMEEAASEGMPIRQLPGGRRARKAFRTFCEEQTAEGKTILAEPVYTSDEIADMPGRIEVLRKDTEFRDYYLTAYRERIPEADRLVISGKTLVNKTAEPMMKHALNCGTDVLLFGPDVPLCPALKQTGIQGIWGFIAEKNESLMQLARVNMQRDQFLRLGRFAAIE